MIVIPPKFKGAYIVKKIDGFRETTDGRRGMHVSISLTQVSKTEDELKTLTADQVTTLLGTDGAPLKVQVPVGEMPLFEVGQIIVDGMLLGKLPYETRRIRCSDPAETGPRARDGVMVLPDYWTDRAVLTGKELKLGGRDQSHYFVFRDEGTEYVIPSAVIFRAFYCPSSEFANEISGSSWNEVKQRFVVDSASSDADGRKVWSLRLASGTGSTKAMLHQLALFTFSPHAQKCINAIHTDRFIDRRADEWIVRAGIPHDTSNLAMTVEGYSVNRYPGRIPRFLVTRIVACEWTAGDVVIEELVDESDPNGESPEDEDVKPGFPRRQRVEGNPNASFAALSNPDSSSNINVFRWAMEYSNAPTVVKRTERKIACTPGSKGSVKPNQDDEAVSGGVPGGHPGSPAIADVASEHRDASPHLEEIGGSLERLRASGRLKFKRIGPAPNSTLGMRRLGAAWSLAGPGTGGEPPPQKDVRKRAPWAWVWERTHPETKFARALFAYEVELGGRQFIVFEIEKRTTGKEAFRFFVLENIKSLPDDEMDAVLENLRDSKGVARDITETFRPLTNAKPSAKVHAFDHRAIEPVGDRTSGQLDDNYLLEILSGL